MKCLMRLGTLPSWYSLAAAKNRLVPTACHLFLTSCPTIDKSFRKGQVVSFTSALFCHSGTPIISALLLCDPHMCSLVRSLEEPRGRGWKIFQMSVLVVHFLF